MRAFTLFALVVLFSNPVSADALNATTPTSYQKSALPPELKLPECEKPETGLANSIACYRDEREKVSKYLDDLLQDIYTNHTSQLGAEADKEFKGKIKAAQNGWEQYKSNHCFFNYHSKASTHPPSVSVQMIKCEVLMTYDRIKEVRSVYRNF